MKHRGITLLTLVMITLLVCGTAAADDSYLKYLPEDAIFIASVTNVDELRAIVKDEKLHHLLETLNLSEAIESFHEQMASGFATETGLEFEQFINGFTGGCTLVFFEGVIEDGTPNLAIYFGIDPEAFPFETLIERAIDKEGGTPQNVNGVAATVFDDGPTVAIHEGHMFLATSPEVLGKLLAPEKPLASSPTFARHAQLTHLDSGAIVYVDMKRAFDFFSNFLPPEGTEEGEAVEMVFDLLGLKYITSISAQMPLASDEPARIFIHAPGYEGIVTDMLSPEPVGNELAAMLPATCDSCGAFSIQKPTKILDTILDFAGMFTPEASSENFYAMLAPAEEQLGFSFRTDVFDTLGTKLMFGLTINPNPPEEPMPLAMLYFDMLQFHIVGSLDDPATLLSSLRTMIEAQMLPLVESEYKGASVFLLDMGMLPVSPAFAIHGSHLLFTMDYELMTAWLDALDAGQTLAANPDYARQTANIPAAACMTSYISESYLKKYFDAVEAFLLAVLPNGEEGEFDIKDRIVEAKAALIDYIGTDNGGYSYVLPTDDGVYMQGTMKTKVLIGMVPVWMSIATMQFADFGEIGEFDDDYEYYEDDEYEDEEDDEPHEIPHAPLLH